MGNIQEDMALRDRVEPEAVVQSPGLKSLNAFLTSHPSVKYIRFHFLDFAAVLRVRIATRAFAQRLAANNAPIHAGDPMSSAVLLDGTLLLELAECSKGELWPDWSSLKSSYDLGHAQVMCYITENGPTMGRGRDRDPRTILERQIASAKEKHDLGFLVGSEIEFQLVDDSKGTPQVLDTGIHIWSLASIRKQYMPMLEEMVDCLQEVGIDVRQFHSEGPAGVFEISLEPLPPMEAVDAMVYAHQAIRSIALRHGFHATMHPSVFEKGVHIGEHLHVSLSNNHHANQDSFLAGLLATVPALCAFAMPNPESYDRIEGVTGDHVCWGTDNRACPIRKIYDAHWELRFPDGTANPYLLLAGVIAAGVHGIEEEMELTIKDKRGLEMKLEQKLIDELNITTKMPTSPQESLKALTEDEMLNERLGKDFIERFVFTRGKELEGFAKLTRAERVARTMEVI